MSASRSSPDEVGCSSVCSLCSRYPRIVPLVPTERDAEAGPVQNAQMRRESVDSGRERTSFEDNRVLHFSSRCQLALWARIAYTRRPPLDLPCHYPYSTIIAFPGTRCSLVCIRGREFPVPWPTELWVKRVGTQFFGAEFSGPLLVNRARQRTRRLSVRRSCSSSAAILRLRTRELPEFILHPSSCSTAILSFSSGCPFIVVQQSLCCSAQRCWSAFIDKHPDRHEIDTLLVQPRDRHLPLPAVDLHQAKKHTLHSLSTA